MALPSSRAQEMLRSATMVDSPSSDDMREQIADLSQRLDQLSEKVDKGFERMERGFAAMERGFRLVDQRFDQVAEALAEQREYTDLAFATLGKNMDAGFSGVDSRFVRLERKVTQFMD